MVTSVSMVRATLFITTLDKSAHTLTNALITDKSITTVHFNSKDKLGRHWPVKSQATQAKRLSHLSKSSKRLVMSPK